MSFRPVKLTCEYLTNPLGIDVEKPRLGWRLEADQRGKAQSAYRILVAGSSAQLDNGKVDIWDSGKVESGESISIEYGGPAVESGKTYWWKLKVWDESGNESDWSEKNWWEIGLMKHQEWNAQWIGLDNRYVRQDQAEFDDVGLPCPFLRKDFKLKEKPERARVYVTAMGLYELYLNGQRVGNDWFTPGWTDYTKRIQYQTYDVTELLREEENTVGAILGDGWYAGNLAHVDRHHYGPYPLLLLMQMEVTYPDGSTDRITTDGSWLGKTGPILFSDMLMGEMYDAGKELDGWNQPGFDSHCWNSADVYNRPAGKLVAQNGPCVRVTQELSPVEVRQLDRDTFIFDMGQNMVGRIRIKVQGAAGTRIVMRFGEMVNDDGSLYTENLRTARATDIYVLKGSGEEIYEPRFTFHGFRYMELKGYPGKIDCFTVKGIVMHSDVPMTGRLECSNPMVNQLQSNITWGQRGNFFSVPTDCPQRNERMGWTGDAQIFARTAAFNMDVAAFFTKYMQDVEDAQLSNGAFTDVAPQVFAMGGGNAAWGDAGVIIPWTMYLCYGDKRIIERHYYAMTRWIDFMQVFSDNLLRPNTGFGDWLSINADTPNDVMGTAYFAYSTRLLSRMAAIIGRKEDAKRYEQLFCNIRDAFNRAYVAEDGRIKGNTQTCYVLALHMDLLPPEKRSLAAKYLVEDIESKEWHLSTGFVGVGYLLPVLTEAGYVDVAYRLLANDTYPSWGYSIKNGATTVWERWNSYTRETGFGDVGMNSFNHYSLGSVGEWMYRYMAGIEADPENPGYRHFSIRPRLGGGFTHVKARYESIQGRIGSEWQLEENNLKLSVQIPPNTTAHVHIPASGKAVVLEGDQKVELVKGIKQVSRSDKELVLLVPSGKYKFTVIQEQ